MGSVYVDKTNELYLHKFAWLDILRMISDNGLYWPEPDL